MKNRLTLVNLATSLCFFFQLVLLASVNAQGRIVVSHDVNTFASQYGDIHEQEFAVNVAEFLTEYSNDSILVIEANPNEDSRNFAQEIKDALDIANFKVTYTDTVGFSLNQLQQYGAVFTGVSSPSNAIIDNSILINYVNQGGNVYLFAGVSGDPSFEASLLNLFLDTFGLKFSLDANDLLDSYVTITSTHQIFNNVDTLHFDKCNSIIDLGTNPNAEIIQFTSDQVHGLYAVVDPSITHIKDKNRIHNFYVQNYPNPFSSITTIKFELPETAWVNLIIYNQLGQKVKELINNRLPTGINEIQWDGKDDKGLNLANGVYLGRLKVNNSIMTHKFFITQ